MVQVFIKVQGCTNGPSSFFPKLNINQLDGLNQVKYLSKYNSVTAEQLDQNIMQVSNKRFRFRTILQQQHCFPTLLHTHKLLFLHIFLTSLSIKSNNYTDLYWALGTWVS